TAFLISNSQIYKSANGYYNWSKTTDIIDEEITKFYFLNENDGWIVTYADGYQNFYSTNDGGNNLILKFSISTLELNNTILNLELSTPDFGFFSTGENTFIIDGNGYINVYEYYPSLNDLSFGKVELGDATFRNQNLMYLIPNGFPYALIKIENSIASYYDDFEMKKPLLPYFFGDTGYLQTATRDIFKTVNNGLSWTRIKSFEKCMYKVHFFDENIGLAFFCAPDQEIYRTIDGGITWDKYFTTTLNKHHSTIKNASKNYPYLTTLEGKLWKYIDE
ncbi:MAG: hypothetical protein WA951_01255, partial [Leeuwenhoekiella sp.]